MKVLNVHVPQLAQLIGRSDNNGFLVSGLLTADISIDLILKLGEIKEVIDRKHLMLDNTAKAFSGKENEKELLNEFGLKECDLVFEPIDRDEIKDIKLSGCPPDLIKILIGTYVLPDVLVEEAVVVQ